MIATSFFIFLAGITFSIVLDKLILKSEKIYFKTKIGATAILFLVGFFLLILSRQENQSLMNSFLVTEFVILYLLQISINKAGGI